LLFLWVAATLASADLGHVFSTEAEDRSDRDVSTEAEDRLFGRMWRPRVGEQFQIVLSATVDANRRHGPLSPEHVRIFDIDLFENDRTTIRQLKRMGKKVVCYFSVGTSEDWRDDYKQIAPSDMGAELPMWPGERWLNIRSPAILKLMKKRVRYASRKGCQAIDPDNVDGFDNENGGGFTPPLTKNDTIVFMRKLSRYARLYGMSTGLKNAMDTLPYLDKYVEFAVNEECATEEEACEEYEPFLKRRGLSHRAKPVFHIEYVNRTAVAGSPSKWEIKLDAEKGGANLTTARAVRQFLCVERKPALSRQMSTVIKVLSLDGWLMTCDGREYDTRGRPLKSKWEKDTAKNLGRAVVDPEYQEILDAPDELMSAAEAAEFEAELARDLVGLDNTSRRKGAVKDRRPSAAFLRGQENSSG